MSEEVGKERLVVVVVVVVVAATVRVHADRTLHVTLVAVVKVN